MMRRRIRKSRANSTEQEIKVEVVRSRPTATSIKERTTDLQFQRDVVNLNGQGLAHQEIANALGITKKEVIQYLARGLEEYYADRNDAVQRYLAITVSRYNRIFQTWIPKTEDHYETRIIDGVKQEVFVPADPEATRIVLRGMNDFNRMLGFNKIRVEHTGANGSPLMIEKGHLQHLTDEQLEKAAAGDTKVLGALPRSASS